MNDIQALTATELDMLITELEQLDPKLRQKVNVVLSSAPGITTNEAVEYLVLRSPALWAAVYLDWWARDYQIDILEQGKQRNKLVLRFGRRLGKTECMCILILWHAYTQINKGPGNQYDILIITPFEDQVDLIFERLHQLIDGSPILQQCVARDVYHRIEFANGSSIDGFTAGSKSGTGAANTRGQRADLLILDESDYMGSSEITNILNIRNEAPERIKIMCASTPSGKREEYYKWCTGASISFEPPQEDIENNRFTKYNIVKRKGNGWVHLYAPSIVNKELLKINKDTEMTYLEELRQELTEMRFRQEVLAEFGEEAMGVYQKKFLDWAVEEGARVEHRYTTEFTPEELKEFLARPRTGPRILGVDWDKYGAATNMVCVELDKLHRNAEGLIDPIFKVLFRVEIPRGDFTYTNAVDKIIELNDQYDFDWVAVDKGYGETQIELLHKYGMNNPYSGLQDKVVGYQFSEKIMVFDPYTRKKDKKPLKPFMVNNSVVVFEKHKMILHPNDKKILEQFEQYRIKAISPTGIPTYDDKNEHMVDATNLCLLIFEQKYGELLKQVTTSHIGYIPSFKPKDNVKPRDNAKSSVVNFISLGAGNGYIRDAAPEVRNQFKRTMDKMSMPSRRNF